MDYKFKELKVFKLLLTNYWDLLYLFLLFLFKYLIINYFNHQFMFHYYVPNFILNLPKDLNLLFILQGKFLFTKFNFIVRKMLIFILDCML